MSVCACLSAADSGIPDEPNLPPHNAPASLLEMQLTSARALAMSSCKVAPLSMIDAPEALAFESDADTLNVDVEALMPSTAEALENFRDLVTSAGGTFALRSAYRPAAYQAHLHEVWVKWVKELRSNKSAGCRALRDEVGAEFKRHQLLVRQQPVPASDHALGLAFDASVVMPRGARLNRKRVTVDKLARLAGIVRPNSRRDPVHFKLIAERPRAAINTD